MPRSQTLRPEEAEAKAIEGLCRSFRRAPDPELADEIARRSAILWQQLDELNAPGAVLGRIAKTCAFGAWLAETFTA